MGGTRADIYRWEGINLTSEEMTSFRRWGVAICISSAHYPQSNGRAEAAVKTAKRIIRDNTGPGGTLDCDRMSLALPQYLNTPLRNINRSPAQLATGRQLRDGVPTARQHLKVDRHWQYTLRERERKLPKRMMILLPKKTCRNLTPLEPGTPVRAQNPVTKLWDRTGSIVETSSPPVYSETRWQRADNTQKQKTPPPKLGSTARVNACWHTFAHGVAYACHGGPPAHTIAITPKKGWQQAEMAVRLC